MSRANYSAVKSTPPRSGRRNTVLKWCFVENPKFPWFFVFGYTICHTMSGLAGLGLLMQRLFCECCLCAGLPGWAASGLPGPNQHGWAAWACCVLAQWCLDTCIDWCTYRHTYLHNGLHTNMHTYLHISILTYTFSATEESLTKSWNLQEHQVHSIRSNGTT